MQFQFRLTSVNHERLLLKLSITVNDHIPKDPYSLSYVRVDDAISILQSLGRGAFMAENDLKIKSAFRQIPIYPDDWNLLGIYWQS